MGRKHRQCPVCKSKKGFQIDYSISGNGFEIRNFQGKVLDTERNIYDDTESYAVCVNCNAHIDAEKLEID